MSDPNITITITGLTLSGKTPIAEKIAILLSLQGIDVELRDNGHAGDPMGQRIAIPHSDKMLKINPNLTGAKVLIHTVEDYPTGTKDPDWVDEFHLRIDQRRHMSAGILLFGKLDKCFSAGERSVLDSFLERLDVDRLDINMCHAVSQIISKINPWPSEQSESVNQKIQDRMQRLKEEGRQSE